MNLRSLVEKPGRFSPGAVDVPKDEKVFTRLYASPRIERHAEDSGLEPRQDQSIEIVFRREDEPSAGLQDPGDRPSAPV
jgi:hypothetical protein